ncbi:fungal-specific transcription factor domain-containing protein [Lophiotrema nucula]|uniref:Fungal-specific transcription factor domain-containing protein n=1 Tax=Lophiotrema nucula TaxID=690887 RepID=A0A6A5ZTM7_9PLEO|nr:fungal-specific transcription factor domain-containing protein [Lophiotrema nucula]
MSYARLILSASAKEALPTGLHKSLPPRFAATPLIQHYLDNIFTLLPIFEEASLYSSVDAVYHPDEKASAFNHWTVRMVLAIACLSQSEQRGDTLYSDAVGHVNAALEHSEEVLHPGMISSIQATLLLVEYAMMDPHHFDSWTLIGAASRAMVDLGIHQDPPRRTSVSRNKLEIRRRVYWCVYALDRSTSLVQTRAFSFSDDASQVSLPFHQSSMSPKNTSGPAQVFLQSFDAALAYFQIREIQSEWYMDLFQSGRDPWQDPYPYIWRIYARMTDWIQSLPASILPSTKSFFELELLYSYVYILSPSPRIPHIHEYAQRLIFEHGIGYATNLIALISKPSNTTKPPVTFYDAMRAYMTGRQFVDVLSRNIDVILDPMPPTPPAPPAPPSMSEDPLAPPVQAPPPPFPSPLMPDGLSAPQDPTARAINAINDFTNILSKFGLRFGFTHWRDRFQRESTTLLQQLYQRASISPLPSPLAHNTSPQAHPTFHSQPWLVTGGPVQPLHHGLPTTPPNIYPPQPSPFGTTHLSPPFSNPPVIDWGSTSPQTQGTSPLGGPSPLAEMPLPSEGRVRQARVFGAGIHSPNTQPQQGGEQVGGGWDLNAQGGGGGGGYI